MSLILEGIDLPKKIKETNTCIDLTIVSDGRIFDADLEEVGRAIQIPKGHGDIKDIDQITKLLPKIYLGGVSHMVINDAPTILEAEETNGD